MNNELLTQFEDYEDSTGLRYAFNVLPNNKQQEKNCTLPISCLYQPLKVKENLVTIESLPISCKFCNSIINPYCLLDNNRNWICSVCNNRNLFQSNVVNLPVELNPDLADIEYVLPQQNFTLKTSIFTYIIDLGIEQEELDSLKETLIDSIGLLPNNSLFSLITFGKNVNVYELSKENIISKHTFNGFKEYTKDQISNILKIVKKNGNENSTPENNRFFQNTSFSEDNIITIIESLKVDSFTPLQYNRREKSTGCAINLVYNILSILYPKIGARIMLFIGGPCTIGPGNIVSKEFKDPIRSHHDLNKDNKASKKFKHNLEFYNNLANKLSINGHTFDIFIGCYDQIGLMEMESLSNNTGGIIVQSDSFTSAIFKQSLMKFLSPNEYNELPFGLNATLEIKCANVKVNGLIGNATALKLNTGNNNNNNSTKFYSDLKKGDKSHGITGTNIFKLGAVSNHSTYGVYFDLNENITNDKCIIQFITTYQHIDGSKRIHVTTSQRFINQNPHSLELILDNFDQEAATVLVAREAVYKVLHENSEIALKFLNRVLIDFLASFSTFKVNDPHSIFIPPNINLFPQFMYHLRRSNFVQIFNSSPDESTFYRHCLLTEDCYNSLIMVQPSLTSFEIGKEPEPVLLDSTSIKPDRILFLDTFFHILIYHGTSIADWRRQGYHNQPEYEYLKEFLDAPRQEAAEILTDRFPLPRFIDTEEGGSQARFLMSKLNPANSYKTANTEVIDGSTTLILTDDISLLSFMQYVYEAVVKPA